jgi:hypothetical protein
MNTQVLKVFITNIRLARCPQTDTETFYNLTSVPGFEHCIPSFFHVDRINLNGATGHD